MAEFQELIKNFDRIRDYMRQFYVYGFKVRGDYDVKSARTYDNEKRRIYGVGIYFKGKTGLYQRGQQDNQAEPSLCGMEGKEFYRQ